MSVPLPLHRAPAAGFEQPFEMLAACHERVERMLVLLERLDRHLQAQGADSQARDAARDVMRYFDQAAPHHHEDEERHVLPALRAAGRAELADLLHAEHHQMNGQWAALRVLLERIQQGDWPAGTGLASLPAFAALYRAHIAREDALAFPLAAAGLAAAARQSMGQEMAERRGLR